MRRHNKEGPYMQAEMRLFQAAQIPVDSLRYKAKDESQKLLRSESKLRQEAKKEMTKNLLMRMEKTKPKQ